MKPENNFKWSKAQCEDFLEVHNLIIKSDQYLAKGREVPIRSLDRTLEKIQNDAVFLLKNHQGSIVATYTLSKNPAFPEKYCIYFPVTERPIYLGRSVVDPQYLKDSFLGLELFRNAKATAKKLNYTMIRLETNSDFSELIMLLYLLKFKKAYVDININTSYLYL